MPLLFKMEIADICFEVYGSIHLTLTYFDPAYTSFLKQTGGENFGPVDIKICLEPGPQDTEGLTQIFDSDQSWSMYEKGEHYFISRYSHDYETPFWLAKIHRDLTEATLYYSDVLLGEDNGRMTLQNPVSYPLDQILLMYLLSQRQGALIHAAGIDINGKGLIFPGTSGAGKSTLSRQFPVENIQLLSDDRIVARKLDNAFKAYGTPWPGEAGIAVNRSVSLSGIFFLNHAADNRIKEIKPQQALKRLLPVTSIPWYDREIMPKILHFCEDLVTHVPAYDLYFRPDVEVLAILKEFI